MNPFPAGPLAIVPLLCVAMYGDVKRRIIPNWLTLSWALGGILFHTLDRGDLSGMLSSIWGLLLGMALLLLPFLMGKSGGGDVKLLGAMGAWLGWRGILVCFVYGALVGSVFALFYLRFGRVVEGLTLRLSALKTATAVERAWTLPYSLPMAAGYLIYLFIEGPA